MELHLSRAHFPIRTLGPGSRIGIWFQGCSIRCPGCVSKDTWARGKANTTVQDLIAIVENWLPLAEGITISGGEPFEQEPALIVLIEEIRRLRALQGDRDLDVLVYSGFSWETLELNSQLKTRMKGLVDALICDPFLISEPQTKALRGSDNQRLFILSSLGEHRFRQYDMATLGSHRQVDMIQSSENEVWLAGIPLRGDLNGLISSLEDLGHQAATTEDKAKRSIPLNRSENRNSL